MQDVIIHYTLGLNNTYTFLQLCYSSVKSIHLVVYYEKHIMNDDSMAILDSWLVAFLIPLYSNLWNRDVSWILLPSHTDSRLPISRNVELNPFSAMSCMRCCSYSHGF